MVKIERALTPFIRADLAHKMVVLSGPRQAGKTTLARALASGWPNAQVLNWDVAADRRVMLGQSGSPAAGLVVFDELHKMAGWKAWLKGVFDGRPEGQVLLVTGSARLDTFRQSGESLAGRFFSWRLHPVTISEWVATSGATPEAALARIIERGGFPEPLLADLATDVERWRQMYLDGIIRDDILEFSRVGEIGAMRPFHRNIARALLKEPKVYFFDTGLVLGDEGVRFENACATMLLRHANFLQDSAGRAMNLHYVRDKEGREIDFALCEDGEAVGFA